MQCTLSPSGKLRVVVGLVLRKNFSLAGNLNLNCTALFHLGQICQRHHQCLCNTVGLLILLLINAKGGQSLGLWKNPWLSLTGKARNPPGALGMPWCSKWEGMGLKGIYLSYLVFIYGCLYSCLFTFLILHVSLVTQNAELRGRVRHHNKRGNAADVLICTGSCGTACPSLPAGAYNLHPAAASAAAGAAMTGQMGKMA